MSKVELKIFGLKTLLYLWIIFCLIMALPIRIFYYDSWAEYWDEIIELCETMKK